MTAESMSTTQTDTTNCLGVVLAGGASRRMGADKALIEINGMAMAARATLALQSAGLDEVIVVGGDADRLSDLGLTVVPDLYPGRGPLGGIITALVALDELRLRHGLYDRPGRMRSRELVAPDEPRFYHGLCDRPGRMRSRGLVAPDEPRLSHKHINDRHDDSELSTAEQAAVVMLPCDVITPSADSVRVVINRLAATGDADAVIPTALGEAQWLHGAWRHRSLSMLEAAFEAGVRAPRHVKSRLNVAMFEADEPSWFYDADSPHDLPLPSCVPSG